MVLLVTAHTMAMIFIVLMSVILTITRLLLFFTTRQKSKVYCISVLPARHTDFRSTTFLRPCKTFVISLAKLKHPDTLHV